MVKAKTKTFWVVGSGLFPFDMLRYDHCFPYTETDSGVIEKTTHRHSRSGPVSVMLETASPNAPTVGRWESFGWTVDK